MTPIRDEPDGMEDEVDEYANLARDGVEHRLDRVHRVAERRHVATGRRGEDKTGWIIRSGDLGMVMGISAIVVPMLGVAFYIRDIATTLSLVVATQTTHGVEIQTMKRDQAEMRDHIIRIDAGASVKAQEIFKDLEGRLRVVERAQ